MERFESVIDDVKDMGVLVYADPVENAHKLEIWAKRGDEEHLYRFIGPGVRNANIPMFDDRLDLAKENEKLIFEKEMLNQENKKLNGAYEKLQQENTLNKKSADTWEKEYYRLSIENEKLKKDLQEIQEAFPMTANKILYGEGELKVENKDTDRVENVLVNVDRFDSLLKDNEKLREQNQMLSECNKDLREGLDKVSNRAEELRKMINESNGLQYPNTRERILEQAKECVCGHRVQEYGTPESNFQLIADLWNGYLGFTDNPQWKQIRATDVAMMMALMKIARIRNGGGSGDSFVDLAGYAACGGEIWHGERHSNT